MPIDASKAELALVQEFLDQVKDPDDIELEKNNAANQRGYIKDALMRMESETVSTNYVYEFQTSNIADLFPRDPMARISPRNKMWGPDGTPPEIQAFSDTMEHLINFMLAWHTRGGTSFDQVMKHAYSRADIDPRADILIITDGQCEVTEATVRKFNLFKKEWIIMD